MNKINIERNHIITKEGGNKNFEKASMVNLTRFTEWYYGQIFKPLLVFISR